jgi:hypothetical protein
LVSVNVLLFGARFFGQAIQKNSFTFCAAKGIEIAVSAFAFAKRNMQVKTKTAGHSGKWLRQS